MGYVIFSVISILFLMLYEKIEIRFFYLGGLILSITYSVIEISFWNFNSPGIRSIFKKVKSFGVRQTAYKYILSRSDININRIYLNHAKSETSKNAITAFGSYPAVFSLIIKVPSMYK